MPTRPLALSCTFAAGLAAALASGLTGCAHPINNEFRYGAEGPLEVFLPQPDVVGADEISVTSMDRSAWPTRIYKVPVHGVAHYPTYAEPSFDLETIPRQRNEYPTPLSALDLQEPDPGAEAWQGVRGQAGAAIDALLLVPRLVIRPPTSTDWSPEWSYQRVQNDDLLLVELAVPDVLSPFEPMTEEGPTVDESTAEEGTPLPPPAPAPEAVEDEPLPEIKWEVER